MPTAAPSLPPELAAAFAAAPNATISLATFMQLANAHYYAQQQAIGADGDFITAPEISQIFGELIGLWAVQAWQQLGAPKKFSLLELGPGRGTLLADALRAARAAPQFVAAAAVYLFESSPALAAQQQQKLAAYAPVHITSLSALPPHPTLIIANEFFDALPIQQVCLTPNGWLERAVQLVNNQLGFTTLPIAAASIPPALQALQPASWCEFSTAQTTMMRQLAMHLTTYRGAGLMIDYGYGTTQAGDSLQALRQHQFCHPLQHVGAADLTAHVNFDLLASAAAPCHTQLIPQAEFLASHGGAIRLQQLCAANPARAAELTAAYHRLTHPNQMGELFKVLVIQN